MLKPGSDGLPNFKRLKSVGTIYTTSLQIHPRTFELGFPGITDRFEWFAIDYTGRIWIDRPAAQAVGGLDFWVDDPADVDTTPRVDFDELAVILANDPDTYLLDVRQILEWVEGHVAGANFVPFYEVPDHLDELPSDRPLYVYCGSGYRASAVASLLAHHGKQPVHVDDDWDGATRAGLPIEQGDPPAREPGWTWKVSRGTARSFQPTAGAA